MMINILFIGNYLSRSTGTRGVSESVCEMLNKTQFSSRLCSSYKNKIIRLIDFIFKSTFSKYDIIQIDVYSGPAFYISNITSLIAKFRNKKIMLTLHGGNLPNFYLKNKKRVESVFYRADYIQSPSKYIIDFFDLIHIHYLPNPIDFNSFPFKFKKDNSKNILWVRAFTNIYNPQLAVKVLYQVRKKFSDSTLTMIGPDKGNLKEIKKLIYSLNLESSIFILGPVDNDKLYDFYHSHDVFINTTNIESFGVAVVEAASCGIPIVSTSVGELSHLWTHDENILFSEANPISFSKNLELLFLSKDLKQKLSTNAQERTREFQTDKIICKWEHILTELVSK
jgi:glycosyltransferase involved in cell wall biosynthesis